MRLSTILVFLASYTTDQQVLVILACMKSLYFHSGEKLCGWRECIKTLYQTFTFLTNFNTATNLNFVPHSLCILRILKVKVDIPRSVYQELATAFRMVGQEYALIVLYW